MRIEVETLHMISRPSTGDRQNSGRFNPFCRIAYELALISGIVTLALAAFQGAFTSHATVDAIVDSGHAQALADNPAAFRAGVTYPLYRFHEN